MSLLTIPALFPQTRLVSRGHRLGATQQMTVFQLYMGGTIEEIMLRMDIAQSRAASNGKKRGDGETSAYKLLAHSYLSSSMEGAAHEHQQTSSLEYEARLTSQKRCAGERLESPTLEDEQTLLHAAAAAADTSGKRVEREEQLDSTRDIPFASCKKKSKGRRFLEAGIGGEERRVNYLLRNMKLLRTGREIPQKCIGIRHAITNSMSDTATKRRAVKFSGSSVIDDESEFESW